MSSVRSCGPGWSRWCLGVWLGLATAGCGGGAHVAASATPVANPAGVAPPSRPVLPAGADTCDPYAYYFYGRQQLAEHPLQAAAAFYWMQRLAPASPLGYYSQRVALLMADRRLMRGYMEADRRTIESPRVWQIDSLQVRAITLDPFFPRALDEDLMMAYLTLKVGNDLRSQAGQTQYTSDLAIASYIRQWVDMSGDSTIRAWFAYARGDYQQAAVYWAARLRRHPRDTDLRARRSQALYLTGQFDSARAELETALADARRVDAQTMRYIYDSKVVWEYELGRIHERQDDAAGAREAYERALVEDMSFYPAHERLGYVAARGGDTVTAVTELERALQIKEDDFTARLLLGLVQAGRKAYGPAADQLRRAAEVEPWVSLTHYALADALSKAGDRDGAAAEYRRFLSLAARNDPNRSAARERLASLSAPPGAPAPPR